MNQKYYIGVASGFHDAAIALVDDNGNIVFAEATERFTQNKRALTTLADNYFFSSKIIEHYHFSDYEIGINWSLFSPLHKYLATAFAIYIIRRYKRFNHLIGKYVFGINADLFSTVVDYQTSTQFAMLSAVGASFKNALYLKSKVPYKPNTYFDHHTCHAYHAYFVSDFNDATMLILDGNGDNYTSHTIYEAKNQSIKKVYTNNNRASLGDFYGEITKWCGFSEIAGEQWKVMGMAPYGKTNAELLKDLHSWIEVDNLNIKKNKFEKTIKQKLASGQYPAITREDIAYTCQQFYENVIIGLINNIYKKFPNTNLIISGGCALNSAANGKIHTHTPFKKVFVPSAPADDGCSIGAALLRFKKSNPQKDIPLHQGNPYLGFEIKMDDLDFFKKYSGYRWEQMPYNMLYISVAKLLQSGKIIGWIQGRAEFGPRALGNRSILANPIDAEMKDRINAHVKFREEFRPFAPAIIETFADEYFEDYYPTPYMERVLKIKESKRPLLKAVNHIDNTGRLQTVTEKANTHFYCLINEFYKLTNVPVLLNTSFNVMGKPIVSSASDIAAVFATSGIDVLVVNDHVFFKP